MKILVAQEDPLKFRSPFQTRNLTSPLHGETVCGDSLPKPILMLRIEVTNNKINRTASILDEMDKYNMDITQDNKRIKYFSCYKYSSNHKTDRVLFSSMDFCSHFSPVVAWVYQVYQSSGGSVSSDLLAQA